MRISTHKLLLAGCVAIGLAPVAARSATVFAVTESGYLYTFDSAAPNAAANLGLISGLGSNETVIGIDFRPATGQLYAATDGNQLYTLNHSTANATLVGGIAPGFSGTRFGIDFNPVPDRLRITTDADQNLRCNPNPGMPACTMDTGLSFAIGDVNAGRNPNVVGSAYTNSFAGATATTLYGIDSTLNALVVQNPPNDGVLATIGSLGVNTTDLVGFDILTIDGVNTAFASLTQTGSFLSRFYNVNLATGLASPVGGSDASSLIGAGDQVRALAVATVVPAPAGIWLLGSALSMLAWMKRQRRQSRSHAAGMLGTAVLGILSLVSPPALASSHREAPFITEMPKVDATDFYMFRSYEPGREQYVTLIANYVPLQDAYGGPNYFALDASAAYDIHIDNSGDAREDLTFRFRFTNTIQDIALPVGDGVNRQTVAVPLVTTAPGGIGPGILDRSGLNRIETFTIELIRGARRNRGTAITNADGGSTPAVFTKPLDNVGSKSIPDYAAYAASHVYNIRIPGCGPAGRLFVGQRKEPFAVNLGEVFDLVNTNAVGPPDGEPNIIDDKNITSLMLEVPASCLAAGADPVIGGWTTASLPQARILNPRPRFLASQGKTTAAFEGGSLVQVSRLGNPLVNEVVIGLRDKDRFNASEPKDDPQFLNYVTNPTLPELLEALFSGAGVRAPNNIPRNDLVAVFLTGIPGVTKPANLTAPGEMLRLNTAVPATGSSSQSNLGVLGGDNAGFPNGRRPGDDVVDIELRAAMGVLCTLDAPAAFGCVPGDAPTGSLPYTDGATVSAQDFDGDFPYLRTPLAGSPAN